VAQYPTPHIGFTGIGAGPGSHCLGRHIGATGHKAAGACCYDGTATGDANELTTLHIEILLPYGLTGGVGCTVWANSRAAFFIIRFGGVISRILWIELVLDLDLQLVFMGHGD
jgi:hypothetical protein